MSQRTKDAAIVYKKAELPLSHLSYLLHTSYRPLISPDLSTSQISSCTPSILAHDKPVMQNVLRILSALCALNAWAHARHHHPPSPSSYLTPQNSPNVTIIVWNDTNCGGKNPVDPSSGSPWQMLPIAENYIVDSGVQSYWLSRKLQPTERLDWSKCAGSCESQGDVKGQCTEFLLETSPDSNCHALLANTCYLLQTSAGPADVRTFLVTDCLRVTCH